MLVINTFETSSYQKLIKDITDKYEKNKNIDIVFKRNIENIELLNFIWNNKFLIIYNAMIG